MVMGDLDIGLIPDTISTKEDIVGVMVQYMEVGPKRSTTCPCPISDKVLMAL